jgi:glycine cleavage system H lipoate-binding protein/ferredoxin
MASEGTGSTVKIKLDEKLVIAKSGQTILEVAKSAGIKIPTFCHNEALSPYGACRICTVEVEKGGITRLQASCAYPVEEGIAVRTNTERVIKGRKLMIEFLLARCPNVKAIQDLAKEYGIDKPRFTTKNEDCILCGMCVRVCAERLGVGAIGFIGRGVERKVGIPFGEEKSEGCIACGACTYVCPTGAIQMEAKTRERLKLASTNNKLCRYAMMGVVDHKICPNNYECYRCEVDQRMEELFGTHPALAVKRLEDFEPFRVNEFIFNPMLLYSKGHIWVRRFNGKLRVGLDDFAGKLFGEIDDLKTLTVGSDVKRRDALFEVIVEKRSANMLSPLGGRIADVNPEVLANPRVVSKDPYFRWIYTVESNTEEEIKQLLRGYSARRWMKSDAERLRTRLQKDVGVIITDGGEIAPLVRGKYSDADWQALVKEFFLV